jgi:hypothetical protein
VLRVHLFAEDHAHEAFCGALVERLAREAGAAVVVATVTARGGHGQVLTELTGWQRQHWPESRGSLVVMVDANCAGWQQARAAVQARVQESAFTAHAIGCPDPHVERWFLADPMSLRETLGVKISHGRRKCERALYKRQLANALASANHVVTLGGIEFASEIVGAMDFFRAGKNEPSLKHFIGDLRALLHAAG